MCILVRMAGLRAGALVPEWTLGDRLRKAREHAHLKQEELADEIGVSRTSVSAYEGGKSRPSRPIVLAWAVRCTVDYDWLLTGTSPFVPGEPSSGNSASADTNGTTFPCYSLATESNRGGRLAYVLCHTRAA